VLLFGFVALWKRARTSIQDVVPRVLEPAQADLEKAA
jgi:hypothetical protein